MLTAHLTPDLWARATRQLMRKALAEFAHERLLVPEEQPDGSFVVRSDDRSVGYLFTAQRQALDHWVVDAASISRHGPSGELPLDAMAFFVELRSTLGLSDQVLPVYLEEICSTVAGTAYKLSKPSLPAAELAKAEFQVVETGMTEGHPCFVANNGRLGFGLDEYHAYAPESAQPVRLLWLAARRDRCVFASWEDLSYEALLDYELGPDVVAGFAGSLASQGLSFDDYYLVPLHPWQWWNKLAVTFASELAERRLVLLGEGPESYLAQQSIRTFFNVDAPHKHYVKTALSVLNMGFMRGLSAAYMAVTPAINDWVHSLVENDEVLRSCGLSLLRERAAVGYRHEAYEAATATGSPYRKMLAALWRESPVPSLAPGERLATMAALLHVDEQGGSFSAALVEQSGLTPEEWLRRYLDAYLVPLLHCFYAYDLAFMPHGENVILVLQDGLVRRVFFKDIGEEVAVMSRDLPLPPDVERIRVDVPEDVKLLSIFTDVFDSFFRHLASVLDAAGVLEQQAFWREVASCVRDYQAAVPHLAERFERYDLFADEFALSCLNRLQLRDNRQMVDLADPSSALQLVGTLANPLAAFR